MEVARFHPALLCRSTRRVMSSRACDVSRVVATRGWNWGQISTFEIPFFESADPFVDLLTETASRMRAEASKLALVKSCRPFATWPRSNVKRLDATTLLFSDAITREPAASATQ